VRTLERGLDWTGVAYWGPGSAVVRSGAVRIAAAIERIWREGMIWYCIVY
jgi:hypothetical protein